jgi:hypothetical protein
MGLQMLYNKNNLVKDAVFVLELNKDVKDSITKNDVMKFSNQVTKEVKKRDIILIALPKSSLQ